MADRLAIFTDEARLLWQGGTLAATPLDPPPDRVWLAGEGLVLVAAGSSAWRIDLDTGVRVALDRPFVGDPRDLDARGGWVDDDGPALPGGQRPERAQMGEKPSSCRFTGDGGRVLCPVGGPVCRSRLVRLDDGALLAEAPGCEVLASGPAGAVTLDPVRRETFLLDPEGNVAVEERWLASAAAVGPGGFALLRAGRLAQYAGDGGLVREWAIDGKSEDGFDSGAEGPALLLAGTGWAEVVGARDGELRYRLGLDARSAARRERVATGLDVNGRVLLEANGWRLHAWTPAPARAASGWSVDSNRSKNAHSLLLDGQVVWTLAREGEPAGAREGILVLKRPGGQLEAWSDRRLVWSRRVAEAQQPWGVTQVGGLLLVQRDDASSTLLDRRGGRVLFEGPGKIEVVEHEDGAVLVERGLGGSWRLVDAVTGELWLESRVALADVRSAPGVGVLAVLRHEYPVGPALALVGPAGVTWQVPLEIHARFWPVGDLVVVHVGQGVAALDTRTGEVRWARRVDPKLGVALPL